MRHPTDGVLRRLVDEPAGVSDPDRRHVSDCPVCLATLAGVRDDATAVDAALRAEHASDVDVPAAWRRLSATMAREDLAAAPARAPRRRSVLLRRPAFAALGVALVLAGGSVAAASDWFQIFRTEQIKTVTVSSGDLVSLPDLSAYGDLVVTQEPNIHEVPDAAAAASETGLDVPEVAALPQGVTGDPTYQVGGQITAEFTFSADRAAQAAAETGETLPPPPAGLDGSTFQLNAGPGVAQLWSESRGVPALVVARAVAPTAYSSGVPFTVVRDYLLSLPGFPADLASQLATFTGDGTTLPLPIPADMATSEQTEVDGHPATLLSSRDGLLAAVVWVDDGIVTAVGGSVSPDEVVAVASDLR
jgi:hypothetical protein